MALSDTALIVDGIDCEAQIVVMVGLEEWIQSISWLGEMGGDSSQLSTGDRVRRRRGTGTGDVFVFVCTRQSPVGRVTVSPNGLS